MSDDILADLLKIARQIRAFELTNQETATAADTICQAAAVIDELRRLLRDRPTVTYSVPSMFGTDPAQMGCQVCGQHGDRQAMGYVCPRSNCPARVTCR